MKIPGTQMPLINCHDVPDIWDTTIMRLNAIPSQRLQAGFPT